MLLEATYEFSTGNIMTIIGGIVSTVGVYIANRMDVVVLKTNQRAMREEVGDVKKDIAVVDSKIETHIKDFNKIDIERTLALQENTIAIRELRELIREIRTNIKNN